MYAQTFIYLYFNFVLFKVIPKATEMLTVANQLLGPPPGAAEQDAGNQVEAAAGTDHHTLQHGRHVRGLHLQPAQTAGWARQREGQAGGRAEEHANPGGGLQEQVSPLL